MSYARFGYDKSEVYVIGTFVSLECLACRITPDDKGWYGNFLTNSRTAMVRHLQAHRQVGQRVPWHASRRLKREARQYGDTY